MTTQKFAEILNDGYNYFLLADIQVLEKHKIKNNFSDDLATEFISNDSANKAIEQGALIAMAGIENHPYTVILSILNDSSELSKEGSQLQRRQNGYILKVENNQIMLFTWHILNDFTTSNIEKLTQKHQEQHKVIMEIPNGWYEVEILGGLTIQNGYLEPTFEFLLSPSSSKPVFLANVHADFKIKL